MILPFKGCVIAPYPDGSQTQGFGVNKTLYSRWGMNGHNGIDLVDAHGTPLLAVEDARVVSVKDDPNGFGRHIRLRSLTTDGTGAYREWTYGHCDRILVKEGSIVREGKEIATMGNTGFVVSGATPFWSVNPFAGTHVHLSLRHLIPDPKGWSYPGDNIKYNVKDYDNGFKGAVDPTYLLTVSEKAVPEVNKKLYAQLLTIQSIINSLKALYGK